MHRTPLPYFGLFTVAPPRENGLVSDLANRSGPPTAVMLSGRIFAFVSENESTEVLHEEAPVATDKPLSWHPPLSALATGD